jgi:hypothetical protein
VQAQELRRRRPIDRIRIDLGEKHQQAANRADSSPNEMLIAGGNSPTTATSRSAWLTTRSPHHQNRRPGAVATVPRYCSERAPARRPTRHPGAPNATAAPARADHQASPRRQAPPASTPRRERTAPTPKQPTAATEPAPHDAQESHTTAPRAHDAPTACKSANRTDGSEPSRQTRGRTDRTNASLTKDLLNDARAEPTSTP